MRVMVIDDSETVRSLIHQMLARRGGVHLEASNGQQALDLLAVHGPADVALVDWNMPVMNGLEFMRQVRLTPAYDRMRLLMVTTENEVGRISAALQAGADEFLMKPFTAEDLCSKLDLVVGDL